MADQKRAELVSPFLLRVFSEFRRRHSRVLFKETGEIILIGASDRLPHLAYGNTGVEQKVARLFHSEKDHIRMGRDSHHVLEKMREMTRAETAFLCKLVH